MILLRCGNLAKRHTVKRMFFESTARYGLTRVCEHENTEMHCHVALALRHTVEVARGCSFGRKLGLGLHTFCAYGTLSKKDIPHSNVWGYAKEFPPASMLSSCCCVKFPDTHWTNDQNELTKRSEPRH
jgi:hypothetical protein